jgi:hypothetical protein
MAVPPVQGDGRTVHFHEPAAGAEHVPGSVHLAAHERLGAAFHRRHNPPVGAAGHRIEAEQHARQPGVEVGLDEYGHGRRTRPTVAGGPGHRLDGGPEGGPALDTDDGREQAGHRRARLVLDGRRRADDQGKAAVVGQYRPGDRQLLVDRTGDLPRRREKRHRPGGQDETGQDGEPGGRRPTQVAGFGSHHRGSGGCGLVQRNDGVRAEAVSNRRRRGVRGAQG